MRKVSRINCHHHTKFGGCSHPDRKGNSCLLHDPEVNSCSIQFKYEKPEPPPSPPPKK